MLNVLDLGRKSYSEVWQLQKQMVADRAEDKIGDTLILVEHDPVFTVGRSGDENIDRINKIYIEKLGTVPVIEVERGGKLTFHGPGQLVGYPIIALTHRDLRKYLRDMERILMNVLSQKAGLNAKPCPETLLLEPGQLQTGVWIRDRKIASIGIAVKQWVTYHGFALNLTTDLRYFQAVNPCGFQGSIMTTLAEELRGKGVSVEETALAVKNGLIEEFSKISREYKSVQPPEVTAN